MNNNLSLRRFKTPIPAHSALSYMTITDLEAGIRAGGERRLAALLFVAAFEFSPNDDARKEALADQIYIIGRTGVDSKDPVLWYNCVQALWNLDPNRALILQQNRPSNHNDLTQILTKAAREKRCREYYPNG